MHPSKCFTQFQRTPLRGLCFSWVEGHPIIERALLITITVYWFCVTCGAFLHWAAGCHSEPYQDLVPLHLLQEFPDDRARRGVQDSWTRSCRLGSAAVRRELVPVVHDRDLRQAARH